MTATLEFNIDRIPKELQRTEAINRAAPDRHSPLRSLAENLSRKGLAQAKTELLNAALAALTGLVFEVDHDGEPANVDRDGRILIPLPWGRLGCKAWRLRSTEARIMRHIMHGRQGRGEPLYTFDPDTRGWLLNHAYTQRTAGAYLRQAPITLAEYRLAYEATRTQWARKKWDGK